MIRIAMLTLAVLSLAELAAAGAPPAWVREIAAASVPATKSPALILLDQVDVSITADGRVRTNRRYAVRITDLAGRDAAAVREIYVTGTSRVRDIRGWVVRRDGRTRDLGGRDLVDLALVNNDVFNEVRVRALGAHDEIAPGDVFAAEVESEDRLLFAQMEWQMQAEWPARDIRRSLTLPQGWRAKALMFNAPAIEPVRNGVTTTWQLRDVAGLPDEEGMPPVTDLAGRLAISVFGADRSSASGQFETWEDVSSWLNQLADERAAAADAVAAKANELAASAATEFDRVAAVARFVQRIQYISIQTGLGRGGGYQPRAPRLVLERGYGDCKDKASLMRALLAALGIKSYLVSIYAGDRNYVREAWPSPQQFNHAVIAVSLRDLPATVTSRIDHPTFGSLLVFDPTDEHTPLGQLPLHEQGSLALIVAPTGGALLKMPMAPASTHAIERAVEGRIGANGLLLATLREHFMGAFAAETRATHTTLGPSLFRTAVERRIAAALPRAEVRSLLVEHDSAASFTVTTTVEATAFAQAQSGLLVVPIPFQGYGRLEIAAASRRTSLQIEPKVVRETVRLQLPAGFAVDELPKPVRLDSPFGRYTVTYVLEHGQLTATRVFEVPMQTIPPDQYAAARTFFSRVRSADLAPAVLIHKP